ncbi:MAG: U32 family peptidase [Desulfocapsa sp.]|nr:MAG: U32 family peptidase [Desulfocapsa sp.]
MMTNVNEKAHELLAPAGSLESFFAAVENGADAVFCGLSQFSARAKAKNFSLRELELVKGYAAKRDVKVFVALNTLIQEAELPSMVDLLDNIEYLQIDAIIIQDLGIYSLARKYFPKIPLHASTQMLSHNLAGVQMLEKMGFSRVVLARELSLQEIAVIHHHSNLEIEHFVHGAMCYSMSGHCLFSSYLDGRSGNRGRCIQPCRRRYHHNNDQGFYFSTSDFSAIELIPELIVAGVSSFKIEGRMKSAEYVASVVAAYRLVIDAENGQQKVAVKNAKEILSQAMGRTASHGFLKGTANKNLVLSAKKGGIGKIIGNVQRVQKGSFSFSSNDKIHVGDRVRVQPDSDRAGKGFTVRSLKVNNKRVKAARKGIFVTVALPEKLRVTNGDLIFKISTGKSFTSSEEACRRRLKNAPLRYHSLGLTIHCSEGELAVEAVIEGFVYQRKYPVEMFAAKRSPLSAKTLHKIFVQTGNPVISLDSLTAPDLPAVVIKPSCLKEIRRNFYKDLIDKFLSKEKHNREEKLSGIHRDIIRDQKGDIEENAGERLFVISDALSDMAVVDNYADIAFLFPLQEAFLSKAEKMSTLQNKILWELPSIVFDRDWKSLQRRIERAIAVGSMQFRLNSLSHFSLFTKSNDLKLIAGPWLYTLNTQAMVASALQGVDMWTLSLEDDKQNIKALFKNGKSSTLLVTAYAPVELFSSRIQPATTEQNFILTSDKGDLLTLSQKKGLTVTRAEKSFSLLGRVQILRKMGCVNFVLDLRGLGLGSEKGQEILQAFYEDRSFAATVPFNFERGLS